MNKLFKVLTFVFFAFIFACTVDALITDEACNINVTKNGINSAQFDVNMPICQINTNKYTYFTATSGYSSYSGAYGSGLNYTEVEYDAESADGKSFKHESGTVPVCNDSKRYVTAHASCTVTEETNYQTFYCALAGYTDAATCVNNGCTWSERRSTCTGTYNYCPTGYAWDSSYTKCVKESAYNISERVTGNINAAQKCSVANGGAHCKCDAVKYNLECPMYECDEKTVNVKACTPEFKDGNNYVYCVNPGQNFVGSYQADSDFNVRECTNSYANTDCGFANILIEGAYFKDTSNDAINLALRLWSYHTGLGGFEDTRKTGIANVTGDSCDTATYFMSTETNSEGQRVRPNVYKNTYEYIMRTNKNEFFDYAKTIIDENNYLPKYVTNHHESKKVSLTGDTFPEISCLKNGSADSGKIGVACGSKRTYRVAFELFFNTLLGNKYMMDHLDALYKEETVEIHSTGATVTQEGEKVWVLVEYNTEDFKEIFGEVEEISCDKNDPTYQKYKDQIEPYCQKKVIYLENGVEVSKERYDKCSLKSTACMILTKTKAKCSPVSGGQVITEIWVSEKPSSSGTSVRKLIPCGNNEDNQIMFEYVPDNTPGSHEERKETWNKRYVNYVCGGECNEYDIRKEETNNCSTEMNKSYSTTIKDPSLSCIVNMGNSDAKNYYDYSKEFGVNTNFCRIYCSDEAEYHVAGRTEALSGRYFEYDVRGDVSTDSGKLLSKELNSVITQKRTCVSEIFIKNLPLSTNWKKIYGLDDDENNRLMANPTWSTLYTIIADKTKGTKYRNTEFRTEVLNQLVYDLYNCNLYDLTKKNMDEIGIWKPGDYKIDYAKKLIDKAFNESNDYGIAKKSDNKDTISFDGGATVVNYLDSNDGDPRGTLGKEIPVESKSIIQGYGFTKNASGKYIKYCSNGETADSRCLQYVSGKEDYSYTKGFSYKSETRETSKYTYPINNYALFEVKTEIGFYNGDIYQTFENTGNITINTEHKDMITLKPYVYALSKYAYNECDGGECRVTQTINLSPFFRAKKTDDYQTAIKNRTFTCSVKVYPMSGDDPGVSMKYRNADPNALFPYELDEDTNWKTSAGIKAQEEIESTANMIETSDELIDYRITLSPEQIKAVKAYNEQEKGNYINEKVYCSEKNIDLPTEDKYLGCTSNFLNRLRESDELGTISPEYNDGISKYQKDKK